MTRVLKWAVPVIAAIGCAVYLLYSAYNDVKIGMTRQLQAQEMILARQAAKGIESLFENYWLVMDSLSKSDHIINLDDMGEAWLQTFYTSNKSAVKNIVRIDSDGRVTYSFPHTFIKGADLSSHDHIKTISSSHKTVFSDFFPSAQGFQTIAFHVPVFKDGNYDGNLGILVDYDYIAENYLDNLRIGNKGQAWVISSRGIELYSNVQSDVGKPASENYKNSESALSLLRKMETGKEGAFHYFRNNGSHNELLYAAYYPARLYNTFWSICVSAPESEVLSHLQGFNNRWSAILVFLTAAGIGFSYYYLRFHLLSSEHKIRKNAEAALRESETRFRTLFEAMTEGVALHEVIYDEQGVAVDYRIISTNPAFERHTGLSQDCVNGRLASEAYGTGSAPFLSRFAEVAKTGLPDSFETPYPSPDRFFFISVTSPRQGQFVTVFENITERRKAEDALRESEERYRRLFEMETDTILLTDIETGRFLDANPAASALYGYSIEELLTMRPVDISAEPEKTIKTIQDANTLVPLRFHKKRDGTIFPVEITGRHSDLDGRRVHIAAIRDISERIEAEKEHKRLEDQLRQAQKLEAVGTLAGGIAHDFNNLLAPIIGYAEMALLKTPDQGPMRRGLEQILNAGLRAGDLVKQILAFSRFTQEQERIQIDVGSVVSEALKLIRSSLPSTIEIRHDIQDGFAMADATQIHQVLINLCTNAAQAMNEQGVLEVSLSRVNLADADLAAELSSFELKPGPYLRLRVADTGFGMDAKTLDRIFDPYFTTKAVGKGSGLGLAVVHGIVKRHKGAICVESRLGEGSVFSVYIPATEANPGSVDEDATVVPPTGTERILLIDDEPAVLEIGTEIMEQLGYQVTPVRDSVDAIELFRAAPESFDLIITDYTMPTLTGIDVIKETRRIRSHIPIILSTGFNEKLLPSIAVDLGVEFIMKPFGLKKIAETARKALTV